MLESAAFQVQPRYLFGDSVISWKPCSDEKFLLARCRDGSSCMHLDPQRKLLLFG